MLFSQFSPNALPRLALIAVLFFTTFLVTQAETKTARNGFWNMAGSWSPAGVPQPGDYIIIPNLVTMNVSTDVDAFNNVIEVQSGGKLSLFPNTTLTLGPTGRIDIQTGGRVELASNARIVIGGNTVFVYVAADNVETGPQTCNVNGCNQPLPVELTYFRVLSGDNHHVRVQWGTASEKNSRYFAIERSADARTFTEMARRDAAGTIQEPLRYEITDTQPLTGMSYYRLRQVDLDGSQHLYRPVSISLRGNEDRLLVFPNPSDGRQLLVRLAGASDAVFCLRTISGLVLPFAQTQSLPDELALTPTHSLVPGIYLLSVKTQNKTLSQKVLVR